MSLETSVKVQARLCQLASETKHKLIIPENVEQIIRNFCAYSPSKEWSGILFYTYEGNFNDGLVLTCKDILLLDQGSSVYTEFTLDTPEIARHMVLNNLMGCCTGLVHSHNTMATFFSGTDTNTLKLEGSDINNFLSLIVNNAGKYTAAITRRVKYSTVEHRTITSKGEYPIFNTGDTCLIDETEKTIQESGEEIVVEYAFLEIEKPDNVEADATFEMLGRLNSKSIEKKPESMFKSPWENKSYSSQKSEKPTQLSLYDNDEAYKIPNPKPDNRFFNTYNNKWMLPSDALLDDDPQFDEIINNKKLWDCKEYFVFLEQMLLGTPFIKEPRRANLTEELKYIENNVLPLHTERFNTIQDYTNWAAGTIDYFLYEYDFKFIRFAYSAILDPINDIPAIVAEKTSLLLSTITPKNINTKGLLNALIELLNDRYE